MIEPGLSSRLFPALNFRNYIIERVYLLFNGILGDKRPEGGNVLTAQLIATAVTWVFAIVVTFILLKVLDAVMGLRVSPESETEGLDVTEHGEEGYIFG